MSIELPATSTHCRYMTERLLKATLNPNQTKHTLAREATLINCFCLPSEKKSTINKTRKCNTNADANGNKNNMYPSPWVGEHNADLWISIQRHEMAHEKKQQIVQQTILLFINKLRE